jgi:thiamine-phosphate pyrophosphorylase
VVQRLLESGVKLVQLRYKGSSDRTFYEEAVQSVRLSVTFHARILVNDRADIALASGAHGVHLGEDDLPLEKARAILGDHRLIGVSTHSLSQALEASHKNVDYIAVGPIFETQTKELKDAPLGPGNLAKICSVVSKPIVAIGGITLENVAEVMHSGADAVAVISDLLGHQNIPSRAQQYLNMLKSLPRE